MKWEAHQRLGFFGMAPQERGAPQPAHAGTVDIARALDATGEVVRLWSQWRNLRVAPWDGGFLRWPNVVASAFETLSAEWMVVEGFKMHEKSEAGKASHG